ncbi:Uncharacterised protein [Mycobacteroides abscessus]|nr:Uncharacterised protein [Mycobacteroides abscessus]
MTTTCVHSSAGKNAARSELATRTLYGWPDAGPTDSASGTVSDSDDRYQPSEL